MTEYTNEYQTFSIGPLDEHSTKITKKSTYKEYLLDLLQEFNQGQVSAW